MLVAGLDGAGTVSGLPKAQGLYDPQYEKDGCGIGVVAHVKGRPSHDVVRLSLEALNNLSHRGAVGCDPCTGDGAGILFQIPHVFLSNTCSDIGISLPAPGHYGVGMVFLPTLPADRHICESVIEKVIAEEGARLLGWRDVPVGMDAIGPMAVKTCPIIRQFFVADNVATIQKKRTDNDAFERKLYIIRKLIGNMLETAGLTQEGATAFYIVSLSSRTITYKGLLLPRQIPLFYPDIAQPTFTSAFAIIHSRFSTNTFPAWHLAHPYRYICHNGEINTLKGNVNWMRARQGRLSSKLFGAKLDRLFPIIHENQSDSAQLDNMVEFLVMGGRTLPHAMMMLIPEAWSGHSQMNLDLRGFYEYHAAMMEPWDGPAAVAFTDGRWIGAMLDRNGLRSARYCVTKDGWVVLSSEAGTVPFEASEIVRKGRLQPGKMFLIDLQKGRIVEDETIKTHVATRKPFREWVSSRRISLDDLPEPLSVTQPSHTTLRQRQQAFGYTIEELKMLLTPMATAGEEAVGSMGTDTPLAILSERPRLLFDYFRQLFAQVTNPPIDPIREQMVMSLVTYLGPKHNLLAETPEHAHRIKVSQPILTNSDLMKIRTIQDDYFKTRTLKMLFPAAEGADGLTRALDALMGQACEAIAGGVRFIILSDRGVDAHWAPIPALLGVSALHQHLIQKCLRTEAGIIVETGAAREVHHFCLLIGFGAGAVNPYLAFETLVDMAREGYLPDTVDEATAEAKYLKAINKGLLKTFSKMGISTVQSYCGAQIFEAVGLHPDFIARYFTGTASRIGGGGIHMVAEETLQMHREAFSPDVSVHQLHFGGEYHYRAQGEHHNWHPEVISTLQQATWNNHPETYRAFSRLANDETKRHSTLRGLLAFKERTPVPMDEVEPASNIVKRFCTGAMSFGSISKEAHETLAIAMNRMGGRSNTGEGGEEAERYDSERNSAIKQVASARFGVTTHYLVHAKELQIKIAQGAKPGEGGQLPGHKVDEVIARTRYATPGVTLISPPPHHDIYSIEDLAQLIYDLKNVNPKAAIAVKLVSEVGVGTIAAGVAKAHADLIVISGDSGGTGASPLSSIKHAGVPWELGLAETQQTLVLNNLRSRVRLQTDGQLKTGRDVVIAALLGAEEFGFSTAPLIVEGCIMMRKCHLNTCPVGIATQDPVLRAKFTGMPEHLINYFFFVADEVRELMAQLGFRRFNEMVGRSDCLYPQTSHHWKAKDLDLSAILYCPEVSGDGGARYCGQSQDHGLASALDHELIRLSEPALAYKKPVAATLAVRNIHRTIGGMLSGEIARRYGQKGLPPDTIQFHFTGTAGQSFGAFCVSGLSLTLTGEANDYVGKSLSGGRIVIYPTKNVPVKEGTILVGNTTLYGATSGEAYFCGSAGERFAVRNSGATAVVEGVGDHGCEYMTGGVVVVLGKTGRNFAAGMSGGVAYVLDEDDTFEQRCNISLIDLDPLSTLPEEDIKLLKNIIERHARYTGSARAKSLLHRWDLMSPKFIRVMSVEYKKILQRNLQRTAMAHG